MNICANCHFASVSERGTPQEFVWYNWRCAHPSVQAIPTVDPVTGRRVFVRKNDLGGECADESSAPYCRSINTDGSCRLYVAK